MYNQQLLYHRYIFITIYNKSGNNYLLTLYLAEGPTKKQAKHLASKYMLEKLEQLDKTHTEVNFNMSKIGQCLIQIIIVLDSWKHHSTLDGLTTNDWYREGGY